MKHRNINGASRRDDVLKSRNNSNRLHSDGSGEAVMIPNSVKALAGATLIIVNNPSF
jgi:hypothetical protein